jgi:hypothetical protein
MIFDLKKSQSAPDYQLKKAGTLATYQTLLTATGQLSTSDMSELEEDLRFYSETGMIGIQMSRLLDLLNCKASPEAA